ncbi:MAG: trypsin-like serine protease [Nitrospira sp.]
MRQGFSSIIRLLTIGGCVLTIVATSVQAQEIINKGGVIGVQVTPGTNQKVDFVAARVRAIPKAPMSVSAQAGQDFIHNLVNQLQSSAQTSADVDAGETAGFEGDGATDPVELGMPLIALDTQEGPEFQSQQFGLSNHPFSTARADLASGPTKVPTPTNTMYPYRATGRLFFTIGSDTFVCSGSLIKRGLVVTAAHCVTDYGTKKLFTNFKFVPGYRQGQAPYRVWTASRVWIPTGYFNGAATQCAPTAPGVVCKDDVAVIELAPQTNPTYPGTCTGWYGYRWNQWGVTNRGLTQVTQLGYPVALDGGLLMQRTDSQGFVASATLMSNTIIGSLMTGGSSGGPWLNNFGILPVGSETVGIYATPNIVVGVTSWAYTDITIKQQGASPFTSSNIVTLVNNACAGSDPRCS